MKETNLKLAQQDIEDALAAIEHIEKDLDASSEKDSIKEKFLVLSKKVEQLESILKEEGILE